MSNFDIGDIVFQESSHTSGNYKVISADGGTTKTLYNPIYGNSSFYKIFNKTPILSEESRNKMAFAKLGKKRSLETRMKISKNHKSKRYGIPKEVCLKISLAQKGRKRNSSGMSGKKHSEETKEKIRKAKRNYANI